MKLISRTRFKCIGRVWHLDIHDAASLAAVAEVQEVHWIATSVPIQSLRCDDVFLSYIDCDEDGRLGAAELKQAVRWLTGQLKIHTSITAQSTSLSLNHIDPTYTDGQRILAQARKMLAKLGHPDDRELLLTDIRKIKIQAQQAQVSEAGIALPNEAMGDAMRRIIKVTGGSPHPSGQQGVGLAQLNQFIAEAKQCLAWRDQMAEAKSKLSPFGDDGDTAYQIFTAIREPLDHFFSRCLAVAHDPAYAANFGPEAAEVKATDFNSSQSVLALLRQQSIATPTADNLLKQDAVINQAYRPSLYAFREQVLKPLDMDQEPGLSLDQWQQVCHLFGNYDAWLQKKPAATLLSYDSEQLKSDLADGFFDPLRALIASSHETAVELADIRLVEKLALYQGHLLNLANNFVSFPHLYDPASRAIFEHGTLIMDGRCYNMAIGVPDRASHIKATSQSDIFVLYVRVGDDLDLAFPITAGGKGSLSVGKRGIFHDLRGHEHHAVVVHIVENPISLTEALVAPFKRIATLISGKIEKMTTAAEKKLDSATQSTLNQTHATETTTGLSGGGSGGMSGGGAMTAGSMLAGGGVALAAIGSSLAYITKTVLDYGVLKSLGGLLAALVAVLIPIAVLAAIKLRQRDLSSILEGSGWAINARMKLTNVQARHFTQEPKHASRLPDLGLPWWVIAILAFMLSLIVWTIFR